MKIIKVEDFYKELKNILLKWEWFKKDGLLKLYKKFKLKLKKKAGDKNENL